MGITPGASPQGITPGCCIIMLWTYVIIQAAIAKIFPSKMNISKMSPQGHHPRGITQGTSPQGHNPRVFLQHPMVLHDNPSSHFGDLSVQNEQSHPRGTKMGLISPKIKILKFRQDGHYPRIYVLLAVRFRKNRLSHL